MANLNELIQAYKLINKTVSYGGRFNVVVLKIIADKFITLEVMQENGEIWHCSLTDVC